jgi:hypothetical protein
MKVGDFVAKISSEWQKHNKWMEFPGEEPQPLGVIVGKGKHFGYQVLTSDGVVIDIAEANITVIDESR